MTTLPCAGNNARFGGGLGLDTASFIAQDGSIAEFTDNGAKGYYASGGAVHASTSLLSIHAQRSVFQGNTARYYGGAVNLLNSTAKFGGNCTMLDNFAELSISREVRQSRSGKTLPASLAADSACNRGPPLFSTAASRSKVGYPPRCFSPRLRGSCGR